METTPRPRFVRVEWGWINVAEIVAIKYPGDAQKATIHFKNGEHLTLDASDTAIFETWLMDGDEDIRRDDDEE